MYIFYRQNRKSVSDFINCFYEGETDDVIKQLQETDYRINEISKQLINNIDDYIYKNELKYPDAKDYLTVKRKVKRRKVLKQQWSADSSHPLLRGDHGQSCFARNAAAHGQTGLGR